MDRKISNNLMLHLKLLGKQEEAKPKISRRRPKIRAKINEIETKKNNTKNQRNKRLVL
jgi:hypothetical protein